MKSRKNELQGKYPSVIWTRKNSKPLKTKLLKIVKNGIRLHSIQVCGIPMFEIECNISKCSVPRQIICKMSLSEVKQLARTLRLTAAKELCPKKTKEETKVKEEDNEIIV
jgi:hypothetical protein